MSTIAFFPEGAYGPTNNCVGIGDVLRRKLTQNRVKLGAGATLLLVLIGGLAIAKAATGGDES